MTENLATKPRKLQLMNNGQSPQSSYKMQFPDFGDLGVAIPWDFVDCSDKYDACPSFEHRFFEAADNRVIIWVHHPDSALRERGCQRFIAEVRDDNNAQLACIESDDWQAVLLWVRVAVMKGEIIRDVMEGTVLPSVSSFCDLGEFVDENCYGGFCDDDGFPEGWEDGHMTEDFQAFRDSCIEAVDAWIKSGNLMPRF